MGFRTRFQILVFFGLRKGSFSSYKVWFMAEKKTASFEELAQQKRPSIVNEFWQFLKYNKKWWLLPIIIVLLLFGVLVLLAGTPAAPFIYSIF